MISQLHHYHSCSFTKLKHDITVTLKYSSFIVAILLSHDLAADQSSEDPASQRETDSSSEQVQEDSIQSWIDDTQLSISDSIHEYGTTFDHFIGKEENEQPMINRSYLRLRFKTRYSHRENFDPDANVYLKLDLPHTKKNWKLILETDPDDFDRLEDKERGISSSSDSSLSGAVGGVRLQGKQLGEWKTNFDLGLKLKFPLDPFTRADLSRVDRISYNWTSRLKQEIFYYHSKGPGTVSSLNFYYARQENPTTILKVSSNLQYLDSDNNWEFVQQAEIFDRTDENNLYQYSIGISADSRPTYSITNSWVSLGWKHRLYKQWLYLSVTPEIDFQDNFNYKINPGIMVELELFFSSEGGIDRLKRKIPSP